MKIKLYFNGSLIDYMYADSRDNSLVNAKTAVDHVHERIKQAYPDADVSIDTRWNESGVSPNHVVTDDNDTPLSREETDDVLDMVDAWLDEAGEMIFGIKPIEGYGRK